MKILQNENFILHLEEMLDAKSCQQIITAFEKDGTKKQGLVKSVSGVVKESGDKQSIDLYVSKEGKWKALYEKINEAFLKAIQEYISQSPALQVPQLYVTDYKIQKSPKGVGFFKWHVDALGPTSQERQIALILYLNDVKEGGETEFYHQKVKISPRAGHILLFPTFWTHMHCGNIPVSDDKYIITGFVNLLSKEVYLQKAG